MSIAEILDRAAEVAETQRSFTQAKRGAWSACHHDRDLIREVLGAWAASEGCWHKVGYQDRPDVNALGHVLARAYNTPAEIGKSLRRAAREQENE